MALATMTKEEVLKACIENDGYETPELNDVLYLHYRGFPKVANLEAYTGCKAIYLESNGLSCLEGLAHMEMLRCLYASKNLIDHCFDVSAITSLATLDLSHNRIESLEGLETLVNLETLNAASNALSTAEAIAPLEACVMLKTIDLQNNNLDGKEVMEGFARLTQIHAMSLNGNPLVRSTPQFRKNMICNLPKLRYLDRPIFDMEQNAALAWREGGPEAERKAKRDMQEAKRNEQRESLQRFRDWQKDMRAKREAERKAAIDRGEDPDANSYAAQRRREEEAALYAEAERQVLQEGGGVTQLARSFWTADARAQAPAADSRMGLQNSQDEEQVLNNVIQQRVTELRAERERRADEARAHTARNPILSQNIYPSPDDYDHSLPREPMVDPFATAPPAPPAAPIIEVLDEELAEEPIEEPVEEPVGDDEDSDEATRGAPLEIIGADGGRSLCAEGVSSAKNSEPVVEPVVAAPPAPPAAPMVPPAAPIAEALDEEPVMVEPVEGSIKEPAEEPAEEPTEEPAEELVQEADEDDEIGAPEAPEPIPALEELLAAEQLTAEEAKKRWGEKDTATWGEPVKNIRVNVDFSLLEQAAGNDESDGRVAANLTFDELMRRAAGKQPKYLTPPTSLPSMLDDEDDDEDDAVVLPIAHSSRLLGVKSPPAVAEVTSGIAAVAVGGDDGDSDDEEDFELLD